MTDEEFAKSTVYEWIDEKLERERSEEQKNKRENLLRKMKTDEKTAERQQVMEMGTMKAIRRREYDAYLTLMCYERKDYDWRENKTEDGVEFTVRIRRFIGLNVNYFLFFLKKLN